jgi:aminoglycoside phosphotransferase (APT) family kinase protein
MQELVAHLEQHFPLRIAHIAPAARGLVAETFVVTDHDQQRWFVKCCRNPLFKAHVVASAAGHHAIAQVLPALINAPLAPHHGVGVSRWGTSIVSVSQFIDAPLTEQYDTRVFGRLIGHVHQSTPQIQAPLERIAEFSHDALWRHLWRQANAGGQAPWQAELAIALRPYHELVATHYRTLTHLQAHAPHHPHTWVVTHGDAGGNVIGHNDDHLTLIDWDYIALAHPERDLWVFQFDERFWSGYRDVVGPYQRQQFQLDLAAFRQYFDYMVYILSEIYAPTCTDQARIAHIDNLLGLFDERNWIQPHLRSSLSSA